MRLMTLMLSVLMLAAPSYAEEINPWEKATSGLTRKDGLIPIHIDAARARILFEFGAADPDRQLGRYIYATGLTGGLGSNPIGLDRSRVLMSKLLVFRQVGNRVLAEFENTGFRASGSPEEQVAVTNSFARAIVWSGDVVAERDGRILVDMTSFLVRDAGDVVARLKDAEQGGFSLQPDLSLLDTDEAHAFPTNLEFDAWLTFQSNEPGDELRATSPNAGGPTLIFHTSLMALPGDGYKARPWDERAGIFSTNYIDMSAPLGKGVMTRLARRWRLQKVTPGEAPSRVTKPIVYHVDNSVPEPIRSALLEGAGWWAEAFEDAGFIDAYRVELLPPGVHPLDARYNVINWVHRATRGWSYGMAVVDPRTGEMMRGSVILGSLRVRQDITIFEGLAGTRKTGSGEADDPIELALARIRQLAAHEVGHTLGFEHNMGASSYMDRASVMDYPAPLVTLGTDGKMDFSKAYAVGMGPWDIWTVKYLYGEYTDEAASLSALITEADRRDLLFVSDGNSRPVSSGHLNGALWDNGSDPTLSLRETLAVRAAALRNFGEGNLQPGESLWQLQTTIVPVYLYHRYQLLAAAKALGGMEFEHRRVGDGRAPSRLVKRDASLGALDAMLASLTPQALDLSDELLALLSPRGVSGGDQQFGRESFTATTGPAFDHMTAVRVASDLTFGMILNPPRLNRMAAFKARSDDVLGADEAVERIVNTIFTPDNEASTRHRAIARIVQARFVSALIQSSLATDSALDVKAITRARLVDIRRTLKRMASRGTPVDKAFARELVQWIDEFREGRAPTGDKVVGVPAPPGSPIGAPGSMADDCWHCDTADLMRTGS